MPLSTYLTRLIWLCVLPVAVFSAWLAYDSVRMLRAENDQKAGLIARNFAISIDYNLNARIGSLKVMAASPLVDDPALWPLYYKVAQGYRENFGSHLIFAEATEPMRMIFNTRAPLGTVLPPLPRPAGSAAAPRAIATGLPAVGDLFVGPLAGQELVAIAVPVRREDKVVKLLVATLEPRQFQERLEQVSLPAGWGLSLLDGQGKVIARRPPIASEAGAGDENYRRTSVRVSTAPWSVVLEIPRELYLAPMMAAGVTLGLGVLAVALIGVGGGLWGTRRLGRAVASLAQPNHVPTNEPAIAEISTVRRLIDEANQRIASFAAGQDRAIEQERRRIAREVHDQLGQVFTAIKLIVQSVPHNAFPAEQEAALYQALEMGIASARRITAELRPPLLDDLGLAAALDYFAREIARTGKLACTVNILDQERLCDPQALTLFRIVQEAVTNILKHAGGTRIDIDGHADGEHYHLRIEDDGRGFDPALVRQDAMGLTNMRERARLINGHCELAPGPAGGTVVVVSLPLDKSNFGADDEALAG